MPEHNVEMIKLLTTGPVLQLNRSKLLPKMFKSRSQILAVRVLYISYLFISM